MYEKPLEYALEVVVRFGKTEAPGVAWAYREENFTLTGDADTMRILIGNNKLGEAMRCIAYRLLGAEVQDQGY